MACLLRRSIARSASLTSPSTSVARHPPVSRSPHAPSAATGGCRSPTATEVDDARPPSPASRPDRARARAVHYRPRSLRQHAPRPADLSHDAREPAPGPLPRLLAGGLLPRDEDHRSLQGSQDRKSTRLNSSHLGISY